MGWITEPQSWIALATLTGLEIVLGVDNIIFISILCGKLPRHRQNKARIIGLALAMITRILLLFSLTRTHATNPTLFRGFRPWDFSKGSDPHGRRTLPFGEGHPRNPR